MQVDEMRKRNLKDDFFACSTPTRWPKSAAAEAEAVQCVLVHELQVHVQNLEPDTFYIYLRIMIPELDREGKKISPPSS